MIVRRNVFSTESAETTQHDDKYIEYVRSFQEMVCFYCCSHGFVNVQVPFPSLPEVTPYG
jgi:hypothetical protein